jgi:hypothetical protein
MTTAIGDMETAYTNAAGRTTTGADYLDIDDGLITGMTFLPGVYSWGSDVNFTSDTTFDAERSYTELFIFKITGNVLWATVLISILRVTPWSPT